MSATEALLVFFGAWILCGVIASLVMGRRGHDPALWLLVGAALGPLVLIGAHAAILREHEARPRVVQAGTAGAGSISVLVGVDGSEPSLHALDSILALLGPRLGRLEITTVSDYDAATAGDEDDRDASDRILEAACARIRGRTSCTPETTVLAGPSAAALVERAAAGPFDYLVIGQHGQGVSKVAFGNVARRVNATSTVPVITVGTGRAAQHRPLDPG